MKIAHLILAHKNPVQLLRLIETLKHPNFYYYVHIDKKVDIQAFTSLIIKKNVFFIKKRVNIRWGGWGTIQATINGFEEIIQLNYDYINVISGQDYPIKSADYIYQYFKNNNGLEFITCKFFEGDWSDAGKRVTEYHLINWQIPGKFRLGKVISAILPKRKFPLKYDIVGKANWFSLTVEAVKYALVFLNDNPKIINYFKYCWGADEIIFSTILYNSKFKNNIRDNLVYVDWNSVDIGHPKLLTKMDYLNLISSDKLFARKFDVFLDSEVFSMLDEYVSKNARISG